MFRYILAAALVVAAVPACADEEDWHPTRFNPGIVIHEHAATRQRTIEVCRQIGAPTRVDHPGCAAAYLDTNRCEIYYASGNTDEALDIQAHERTHCWFGRWHDKPEGV